MSVFGTSRASVGTAAGGACASTGSGASGAPALVWSVFADGFILPAIRGVFV